ncbi:hypothetical protein DPM13_05160 [Paracoccus mutanolyticus]|uniref:Solute-binding protein family 3/N-terminal domain-containing protein n=1 Tax=Paracoccus mutanolyticus TaxID=1499308 RepID=A0ABN5M5P2_9RHOB|nr:hypothetical protein DPM13_05160 [Paracoccus mutanolyticus]
MPRRCKICRPIQRDIMFRRAFMMAAALAAARCTVAVQAEDRLKVGTEANGLPFSFVDPAAGQPDGFMVDVIKAIARHEGLATSWNRASCCRSNSGSGPG